jgi:hypothetical protein
MAEDFEKLFDEYMKKVKLSNELNIELAANLKAMNEILISKHEKIIQLESMMKIYNVNESDVIDFNVGGTIFSIFKSDLVKKISKPFTNGNEVYGPNLFEGLLSGLVQVRYDKNNCIFINRDPKYFSFILNYLRMANTSEAFIYPSNSEDLDGLLKEAEYYKIEGLKRTETLTHFGDSLILNKKQAHELTRLCEFSSYDNWNILYRGSVHGFGAKDFHNKCDGNSKTLTIVKTTLGYIFGGYADLHWDSVSYWQLDQEAFIFSLLNKENKPAKIKHDPNSGNYSICCGATHGPVFGGN